MTQISSDAEHAAFMAKVYARVGRNVTHEDVLARINRYRQTMGEVPLTMADYQAISDDNFQLLPAHQHRGVWTRIVDASAQWWQAVVHDR